MQRLLLILILFAASLAAPAAHANCRWQVHGRMEGIEHGVSPFPDRVWPAGNMEVRVQARTNGGWWNQPNWPATRTDAQGLWSVTSAIGFLDPDCQNTRDFRVQVRGYFTGNNWRTVHQQSVAGPQNMQGLFNPAPTHTNLIGLLICQDDGPCENGVIRVEGLTPPPVELVPGDDENGHDDDHTPPAGDIADRDITIEEAPCGLRGPLAAGGVEFRFGQMPVEPGPVSADRALRTETRARANGDMTLNRIRNHIQVENAGNRDFRPDPHCRAIVWFRLNEGPGRRGSGDQAWSPPYPANIPAITANTAVPVARDGNLLGAGDVLEGEWSSQWSRGDDGAYRYVLIEVTLDATNAVYEQAEGDNRIVHCYSAPENRFVDMTMCQN